MPTIENWHRDSTLGRCCVSLNLGWMLTESLFFHRRFSKSHEWLDFDTETKQGKMGISKHAADLLGDIVHVDLPADGDSFDKGESIVSCPNSTT